MVAGLNASDLVLHDNNVPRAIQMESSGERLSLLVTFESSSSSVAILDKLGHVGILLLELLGGEMALLSFSDEYGTSPPIQIG
ncbi:MAG: hypothetical protein ABI822_27240 [Bryobacteraceae bacterium]